jgi:hypothetical protein
MIRYEGNEFDNIKEFDCHVLSFGYDSGMGGFTTVLPISPLDYREKEGNRDGARVDVFIRSTSTRFDITSDHGQVYTVIIDNIHSDEIQKAIISANDQKLLFKGAA